MKLPIRIIALAMATLPLLPGCKNKPSSEMSLGTDSLQTDSSSNKMEVFTLKNKNGMEMTLTNYGGKVMTLKVPDKNGVLGDIVLGYDTPEEYLTGAAYFGALIGRYGNRIAKAKFTLDGQEYHLPVNNGENHLHGGPHGFHNVFWKVVQKSPEAIELTYTSPDGEEGYPGKLDAKVVYSLTDANEWVIEYWATTDKPTVINLTQHNFYNLAGEGQGDILSHELMIKSDYFTPVDQGLIPSGELRKVEGTPFDFRKTHKIGERIDQQDEQLKFGLGYDHNWILNRKDTALALAATVTEPTSGRIMEVWTTQPALQIYTGNFLNGQDIGKGKKPYAYRTAICLETQHYPDTPNHAEFPSTVLRPGDTYHQKTVYKFSVKK